MANKPKIVSSQSSGFIQELLLRARLILRLMGDRRVNFLLKLIPVAAIIYVVSPIDLIPNAVVPVVGALDDAAIFWLGITLFESLCPEAVVLEHRNALQKVVPGTWRDVPPEEQGTDVVESDTHDDHETR
jgi:uncharacterized membrane protein YkvA (DUF1232 family)